jgi:hypothetical protein
MELLVKPEILTLTLQRRHRFNIQYYFPNRKYFAVLKSLRSVRVHLDTGWMIRGSISGEGEISRTRQDRPWCPPVPYTNGTESIPIVKRPGRGIDHLPI